MKIVVFERVLTHYRLKFYNYLIENYNCEVIFLTKEIPERDGFKTNINEANFKIVKLKSAKLFGLEFFFIPLKFLHKRYNLILLLSFKAFPNSVYLLSRILGQKVYWWGHSKNFQKDSFLESFKNFIKIIMVKFSSGVLAYTDKEKSRFILKGVNSEKITVLNNTVDTNNIFKLKSKVSIESKEALINKYFLKGKFVIGLIGRLYNLRNTEDAIKAIINLNKTHKNLILLIIGDGPEKPLLEKKYSNFSNILFIGSIENEKEISIYMSIIEFFINPGLVGLNLVHTMSYGKSTIIIEKKYHSPEVDFLKNKMNGIISKDSINDFELNIKRLVDDSALREKLNKNAFDFVSQNLTIKMMSENFLKI